MIIPYIPDPKDDIPIDLSVLASARLSLLLLIVAALAIEIASCMWMFSIGVGAGPFIPMLCLVTPNKWWWKD